MPKEIRRDAPTSGTVGILRPTLYFFNNLTTYKPAKIIKKFHTTKSTYQHSVDNQIKINLEITCNLNLFFYLCIIK